jgi:glycine cleavage system H lipoate-binding protein
MPVSGKILSINDAILFGNKNIVLQEPENSGYIALIVPSSPYDRQGLTISEKYRMSTKTTH